MIRHLFDRVRPRGLRVGLDGERPDRARPLRPQRPRRPSEERDDAVLNRSQPDFTLINLPTTLRLPKFRAPSA